MKLGLGQRRSDRVSYHLRITDDGTYLDDHRLILVVDVDASGDDGTNRFRAMDRAARRARATTADAEGARGRIRALLAAREVERSDDELFVAWAKRRRATGPSLAGLSTLRASGAGQFTRGGLSRMREARGALAGRGPLVMVDLREEPHGFLDGSAVAWVVAGDVKDQALLGATREQAARVEADLLDALRRRRPGEIVDRGGAAARSEIHAVASEESLFAAPDCYLRVPTPDHEIPERDADVDAFVGAVVEHDRERAWFHFHCRRGAGRTTTFLCLYDAMHNARRPGLGAFDVLYRQHLIGGSDLDKIAGREPYKVPPAKDRRQFVLNFFLYARESGPDFRTSWSTWAKATGCLIGPLGRRVPGGLYPAARR